MRRTATIRSFLFASTLGLSACGVTYVSPLVNQDSAQDGVVVAPIVLQNIPVANSAPYVPRALPASFSQTAGGGTPRGAGALPPSPVFPDVTPGNLELRVPPAATPGLYEIGVGDVVQLATRPAGGGASPVTGEVAGGELRQQYTVRDDGAISIPEVGTVEIGGMTIEAAEQRLFERFIETGINPDFSLEVTDFNSQRITVGGAVGDPSILPVTLNVPTLDEALTAAGGVQVSAPEFGSIRLYRDGTIYQIPIESFTERGDLRSIQLMPGDSIFVDTSYDLDRAVDYFTQQITLTTLRRSDRADALSELSTEVALRRAQLDEARDLFERRLDLGAEPRDYVYLAGEVTTQDRYALPYNQTATLADALYDSGGFQTETGNPSQIYVLRLMTLPGYSEPVTAWHLDARNAGNLTLATQFELRPNDIIFVEEQPITRWNRAFQQFFPSLITAAGG